MLFRQYLRIFPLYKISHEVFASPNLIAGIEIAAIPTSPTFSFLNLRYLCKVSTVMPGSSYETYLPNICCHAEDDILQITLSADNHGSLGHRRSLNVKATSILIISCAQLKQMFTDHPLTLRK